jgi:hypothetical protein
MVDFHNYWVKKKMLFDLFKNKNMTLLEIGCGQGGDLQKWIDNKFSIVLGVDNNEDNLVNSNHGAYKRMYDSMLQYRGNSKLDLLKQSIMFLLLDGGVKWDFNVLDDIKSSQFNHLTKIAMGIVAKKDISNPILKNMHNILNVGVDVVSCQFAIHYFFESSNKLDSFCYNLNKSMKDGGYFIGTSLDSALVNDSFVKNGNTDVLKGVVNDKIVWQIQKKYNEYEHNSQGEENLGKRVDVYVETINKIIPEYLVDFDLLTRKLKAYNIVLLDTTDPSEKVNVPSNAATGSFSSLWNLMDKYHINAEKFKHQSVVNALTMNETMKQFSFMNRWFIFKKQKRNE